MIAEIYQGIINLEFNCPGVGQEKRKFKITYQALFMEHLVMFRSVRFILLLFVVVFELND